MRLSLAAMLLCVAAAAAAIEPPKAGPGLHAVDAETFQAVAAAVEKELQAGGLYGTLPASDKERVRHRLETMVGLFAKSTTVEQMSKADKVSLVNAQEQINEILLGTERGRMVCEQRSPTGTRIHATECRPLAEVEEFRRNSAKFLSDTQMRGSQANTTTGRGDGH